LVALRSNLILLDDYRHELTSVAGHLTLSSNFVAYTTIDVSAHTNYLIEFLKNFAGNGARQGAQIIRMNHCPSTPQNTNISN